MAYIRYRAIVKVLCGECQSNVNTNRRIDVKCSKCQYKKYNNVNKLIKFTTFLNSEFPNWVWFNVYEYKKEAPGRKLASFQRGKNEPTREYL